MCLRVLLNKAHMNKKGDSVYLCGWGRDSGGCKSKLRVDM